MNESQHHRGPDEGEPAHRARCRARPPPPVDHRRRDRPAAAGQRRRLGRRRVQRRDLQLPVAHSRTAGAGPRVPHRSDTEVIVHAWEPGARTACERFRGMFAFALWDRNRDAVPRARPARRQAAVLRLAADGQLLFGSELKALLRTRSRRRARLDPLPVEEYFALGYVAEPRTIYRQAHKLPPAHTCAAARRSAPAPRRTGTCASRSVNAIGEVRREEELIAPPARVGAAAHDRRSAAGRLPVGWRRFERRGRDDGAAAVGHAGQHLLDRLRRPGLRRVELRAAGGRPLPHQSLRRDGREPTTSTSSTRWPGCTTNPTPTVRPCPPTASASWRAST
jgi:hypothetical protein